MGVVIKHNNPTSITTQSTVAEDLVKKYANNTTAIASKADIEIVFDGDDTKYKPAEKKFESINDIEYGQSCKVLMEQDTTPFKIYVTYATEEYVKESSVNNSSFYKSYMSNIASNIDKLLYIQYFKEDGSTGILLPISGESKLTETQVIYSFSMPQKMMTADTAFIINSNINTLRTATQQNQMVANYMVGKIDTYTAQNILNQSAQYMLAQANQNNSSTLALLDY